MLDYEDGTPASTPQMAYDVTVFTAYMQRRKGLRMPDKEVMKYMVITGGLLLFPFKYLKTYGYYRNLLSSSFFRMKSKIE